MPKILVFTSYGGGGHISASQALKEYLSDKHDVSIVPFFIDVLDRMDPVKMFTFKKYHVEDIYNFCLRRKWSKVLNFIYNTSQYCMPLLEPHITRSLFNFIEKNGKPDLIISVIPLVNHSILKIAQSLDIPFLLIPTDLDSSTFLFGVHDPAYKKFMLSLPYQDMAIEQKIAKAAIKKKQIVISGFPIRAAFFEPKNKRVLRQEFNINEHVPVLLLMMGAEGSSGTMAFLKELLKLQKPAHIIITLGRNWALKDQINKLNWPNHITYSIIGFTDRIADLMAMSDLCITKSGSVSVNECLYMQLPTILDGTGASLLWERFNLNFIKERNLGDVVSSVSDINTLINYYLTNQHAREKISHHLKSFSPLEFRENINKVVCQMLSY